MKSVLRSNQAGIALLQVLFLSIIFSAFMISITTKVNSQLEATETLLNHAAAVVSLNSTEARATYELLTTTWADSLFAKSPLIAGDLFSHKVELASGTAELVSVSSLASIYNFDLIEHLLEGQGYPKEQIDSVMQTWKDAVLTQSDPRSAIKLPSKDLASRSVGIQYEQELLSLQGLKTEYLLPILPYITIYPVKTAYLAGMPDSILSFYLKEPELSQARKLKQNNALTAEFFRPFVQSSEFFTVSETPGPAFVLNFTATVNGVKLQRRGVYVISPYDGAPVRVWEYKKFN